MSGSRLARRNTSIIVATICFGIFGVIAVVIGVVDMMNPLYPYAQRLPILGHIAFVVGILSLVATGLLWRRKLLGGYLGVFSFAIAFLVNVYVGEHPLIHAVAGAMVGLVLLTPLAFAWKNLS